MPQRATLRRATALALTAILASTMTACSRDSNAATNEGPIEIWARSNTDATQAYNELFKEFTAKTGVKVNFQGIVDLDQQLQTRAASKSLPDLIINDTGALGNYTTQGYLRAVTKAEVTGADLIGEGFWNENKGLDGLYYGVPFSRQTMATMIRKDWREKLKLPIPTTQDELAEMAEAFATKDPDGNGKQDTYGMTIPGTTDRGYLSWWASSYMWENGAEFIKANGDGTYTPSAQTPAMKSSVKWIKQQFCTPGNSQPGALTAATSVSNPFFATGKTGIILTGPYNFSLFDAQLGKDKYEVIPTPKGTVDNTVLAEGENIYVTVTNKKTADTKQVIDYLVSDAGQIKGMIGGKQPIVRVPVNNSVDAASVYKDDRWEVVQDSLKNSSKAFPSSINFIPIRQATAESLNAIMADCKANNIDKGLKDMDSAILEELLDQDIAS